MIDQRFVFVSALVALAGTAVYAYSTLRGKTQPNKVTWLLWAVIPLITFFAQLSEGVGLPAVFSLAYAVGPLFVVLASFTNKKAYWKLSAFDIACGAISIAAILLWLLTGDGMLAIIFSVIADFMAGLPTLIKSFRAPKSENISVYAAGVLSAVTVLATITSWNLAAALFPLYILLENTFICLIIIISSRFSK